MEVRDARVLLTGASGGIGPTIARGLAQRGARLVLSGRRVDALEGLAAELGAAEVLPADLADRAGPETLARDAGAVDVFVSNAALPADGQVDDYTPDQIDRALDVNLRAPIFLARALTPAMVQRGRGSVVLVASIGAIATTPGSALYSATKFGLRGFGLALRQDLHGTGVGVTVIHPSFIDEAGMFAESGVKLPPGDRAQPYGDHGRADPPAPGHPPGRDRTGAGGGGQPPHGVRQDPGPVGRRAPGEAVSRRPRLAAHRPLSPRRAARPAPSSG
jgi:short-subunit dehydrogenase